MGTCDSIIHAGDPDDEGQLLVDELIDYLGYDGEVERVLVNDNICENIRAAFENLRPNDEFRGLSEAAYARQMADMCLGVSESRLATMRLGKRLSVGRVQTPTLGLVVRRDAAVEGHVPETYWAVIVYVEFEGTEYEIELVPTDEAGNKRRITDEGEAKDIARNLEGRELVFDVKKSQKRKGSPLPYTLTVLQSEMSKRFGLTLQQTMDATQTLRDKWKAISYNRSDCPYLPREHHAAARRVLGRAMDNLGEMWSWTTASSRAASTIQRWALITASFPRTRKNGSIEVEWCREGGVCIAPLSGATRCSSHRQWCMTKASRYA